MKLVASELQVDSTGVNVFTVLHRGGNVVNGHTITLLASASRSSHSNAMI